MPRYFIEVSYKGTNYSGFQIQQNANSIQAEIEKALKIFYKEDFKLTGSSRTDAGVHALQNFFHFDTESELADASYHLNAILPADIVVKKIFLVKSDKPFESKLSLKLMTEDGVVDLAFGDFVANNNFASWMLKKTDFEHFLEGVDTHTLTKVASSIH